MQRFVALSSSSHQSLVLSPVTAWKSARDGHASLSVPSKGRRNHTDDNVNVNFPFIRGEAFSVTCCHNVTECGGRQQHWGNTIFPEVMTCRRRSFPEIMTCRRSRRLVTRNQHMIQRALGNWQENPDPKHGHHPERHHQKRHRGQNRYHHLQVVDSIGDCASEPWWTDDDDDYNDDDGKEDGILAAEEDGVLWADLWTSRIILQMSLFWNLLGIPPSKVEDWLVSLEARRRLNNTSNNNEGRFFSSSSLSSSPALNNYPLGGSLLEGDSWLDNLREKFFSVKFSQFLSAATPQFRPRDRLSMVTDGLEGLLYPQWLSRMNTTYGASFMLLVALGYVTQGFRCFPWFAVGYMLKDGLQVDPGYMQFLLSSAALPMVAKPIYGIISDTVYIRGAHRVPYLAIAGVLQLISWGALAMSPKATSSAVLLTAALTFGNLGAAIADVMNDALVAEVSKRQKGSGQGELQSFAWLIMASGGLLGNLLGGFALKKLQLTTMYFIFLILLGLHLLICLFVNEGSFDLAPPFRPSVLNARSGKDGPVEDDVIALGDLQKRRKQPQQVGKAATYGSGIDKMASSARLSLWSQLEDQVGLLGQLLKKKEISRTLLWFCASYAVVPVLGSSIFFYQTQVLRIDPTFIGFSRMVGQVGLMVGSQLYGGVLKGLPLRNLLGSVQLLLSFCMLSDFVLVKRLNVQLGIPDEFYVLGASALVDCVSQFKVLPVIVRLGQLCPPGSEGSLMAFFSSCHCLAGLCSGYFGVALANYLHISAQSFEGLPIGIFIQAMFALLPILCIKLIPVESTSKAENVSEKVC